MGAENHWAGLCLFWIGAASKSVQFSHLNKVNSAPVTKGIFWGRGELRPQGGCARVDNVQSFRRVHIAAARAEGLPGSDHWPAYEKLGAKVYGRRDGSRKPPRTALI